MERLLTPREASQYLNCSPRHIIDLIKSGKLPALDIAGGKRNRMYRIRREALEELGRVAVSAKRAEPGPRSVSGEYLKLWRAKRG